MLVRTAEQGSGFATFGRKRRGCYGLPDPGDDPTTLLALPLEKAVAGGGDVSWSSANPSSVEAALTCVALSVGVCTVALVGGRFGDSTRAVDILMVSLSLAPAVTSDQPTIKCQALEEK
ncbi:hypothetical protein ColKHC_01937 [Colletotrichum higginsianum]|nr:hypothetical protein ColKHC_01937 [Colletotrichum higginsianum]